MTDLVALIDAFDRVVAHADGSAPPAAVARAAEVARRVRARRGYQGRSIVVALAGGTGSGKSSLINALAGETVAEVGAIRPTTAAPLAWIPANPEPGLTRLLDDLGIEERVGQDRNDWMAVIDLPDTDSIASEHRRLVDDLLPRVDGIVWVLDPEKYQDRVLHRDLIAPMAEHAERFVFVLNQIDRLGSNLGAVLDDLRSSLRADGVESPIIVCTAADPPAGPPEGLDDLMAAVEGLGEAREIVRAKLTADLVSAAQALAGAAGVTPGGGTGFTEGWEEVSVRCAERLADDVVGPEVQHRARKSAAQRARAATSILRSRLTGASVSLGTPSTASGVLEAVRLVDDFVSGLASGVEAETMLAVRQIGSTVDHEVRGTADAVAFGETIVVPAPPASLRVVAWVRRLAVMALIVAGVWLLDTIRSGDRLVWPVALVVGCLVVTLVPPLLAGRAMARAVGDAIDTQRRSIQRVAQRELDRRIGRPLRGVLRKRARLSSALAEFELARREVRDPGPGR
jgi:GTP-binding protein EngB required for normal cell division